MKKSRPAKPCGGPRMNPSLDVGNPPRPFRHLRMTERRTPDRIYESGPRSFGVGSKIGDHHHQLGRSAFRLDARESPRVSQVLPRKKLALDLPAKHHAKTATRTVASKAFSFVGVEVCPQNKKPRARLDVSFIMFQQLYPLCRASSSTSSSAWASLCARCWYWVPPPSPLRRSR